MSEAAVPLALPEHEATTTPRWKADLALVVAAFFFGSTFVVVQDAIERVAPMPFLALRFFLGSGLLGLVARSRPTTPREIRHGVVAGTALWAGFALQTVGLQYVDPATSAFLTYMLIVFVPVIGFVVWRQRPHGATIAGIALALPGLVLLTGVVGGADASAEPGLGQGELLTLGCAVAFAAHIVIINQVTRRHDPIRFTFVQVLTVAVLSSLATLVDRGGAALLGSSSAFGDGLDVNMAVLLAAMFTGVFATAVAFLAMVWAQRVVSASRAALILLLETVFAAALSWATGDPLTGTATVGALLILIGVVFAEVLPQRRPSA